MNVMTTKELDAEIEEKSGDLHALQQSFDILRRRCFEVRDNTTSRLMPFHEWAGAHALINTFEVVINVASKTVEELKALREQTPAEPALRIVRDDE